MSILRRAAVSWLRSVVRNAPPTCQEWASAMLRELDFIESDWAALLWALGSTVAVSQHCLRVWRTWIKGGKEEATMKESAIKMAGLLLGVLFAALLVVAAFGVFALLLHFFPAIGGGVPWPSWLIVFLLPETLFVVGAVRLWRKRRPMAIGVQLAAAIFGTHFAMHIASHWNG